MTPRRHGMTLIEVLAVLAVIALVSTTLLPGILHRASPPYRALPLLLEDLAHTARQHGALVVVLQPDEGGQSMRLKVVSVATQQTLAEPELPSDLGHMSFQDSEGRDVSSFEIDRNGLLPGLHVLTSEGHHLTIEAVNGRMIYDP